VVVVEVDVVVSLGVRVVVEICMGVGVSKAR
jgi:hypothetical protein